MKTLKFTKSFQDIIVDNVFVVSEKGTDLNVEDSLRMSALEAKDTVCFVLEKGMNDFIAQTLYDIKCRKYIIVPKIEEEKYQKLKDRVIAREVDNIKGNYAIIDSQKLFFFDEKFNGYVIDDKKTSAVLQRLFLKEFWENGAMEFIEDKRICAEVTFDVPPLYSSETVLIDESFAEDTEVETLISQAKTIAFTQKAEACASKILIKRADINTDFLKTTSNENIFLAKDLPCSLVSDGNNTYILNFDIAKYRMLPEKGHGRLFAVKCGNLTVGKTYQFFRHKTLEDLVNKDVLSVDGEQLVVSETEEEQKKISADLRMAAEYEKMDAETLEARLEKKYPNIFKTDKYAAFITYNIVVEIVKRTINSPAVIYGEFNQARDGLRKKWNEVLSLAKEFKIEKKIAPFGINADSISDRAAYRDAVTRINEAVKLVNNYGDDEVDEALSEVTNKKKKKSILPVASINLNMDIPANGKLYQNKDKYEYVLTSESKLSAAMEEMRTAGIENINVQYLAE